MPSKSETRSWLLRQVIGTFSSVWSLLFVRPARALRSLSDTPLKWLSKQPRRAVGLGTPQQQVVGSLSLIGIAAVLTLLSGFTVASATVPVMLVLFIPFVIGVGRLVPVFDRVWRTFVPVNPQ